MGQAVGNLFRLRHAFRTWRITTLDAACPKPEKIAADLVDAGDWITDPTHDYCNRCGASGAGDAFDVKGCPRCVKHRLPWQRVTRLGAYEDDLRAWICGMKYASQWTWAQWFGRQLGDALPQAIDDSKVIVTHAPMHWTRRWHRGYDQAHLIAETLALHRRWPHLPLLKRVRRTAKQTMINQAHRRKNVQDAFAIAPIDLTGHDVVLVDDVMTSGATLTQCGRLLQKAGARSIQLAIVARADHKGQQFKTL